MIRLGAQRLRDALSKPRASGDDPGVHALLHRIYG